MYNFWKMIYLIKGTSWFEYDNAEIWNRYYTDDCVSIWELQKDGHIEVQNQDLNGLSICIQVRLTDTFINDIMNGDNYGNSKE